LYLTLARTGLRIGEALGLDDTDPAMFDFDGHRVRVLRQLGRRHVIGTPKSGHGRDVDLSQDVVTILEAQIAEKKKAKLAGQWIDLPRPSEQGLSKTMRRTRVELSVVACDLRGFTAFSETAAPEEIMRLLEEYYGAVGDTVMRFGGSISNFAGDGIVALVGAPIAREDHAARAIHAALDIRDRTSEILSRWRPLAWRWASA
jgi:class 3 adenylate cyclase